MRTPLVRRTRIKTCSGVLCQVYERPYMVLPPLVEWLRVTVIFCEARHCGAIDQDDVYQAARILLPGADCPPRGLGFSEQVLQERCRSCCS